MAGNSTTFTTDITVRATRARDSGVDSIRSSWQKISSEGTPCNEHDARNFVILDVRMKPSSRGSTGAIVFGLSLFMSLRKSEDD